MIRILLAEDDALNRDMLRRRLERRDCTVITAENGAEVVRLAAVHSVDVILMDVAMPQLSGWDAVERIRQRDTQTPILMLSAHAFADEQRRAGEHDVQGYLSKPLQMDTLMAAIVALATPGVDRD